MVTLLLALALVWVPAQDELVLVKDGTKEYHRPHCEVVRAGLGVLAMTRAQAEAREYRPHAACDPANEPPPGKNAPPAPAGSTTARKPRTPAVTHVYVDAAGKHYHREGCKRLGKGVRKLALDAAGRKYWPCSVCRPPIRPRKR